MDAKPPLPARGEQKLEEISVQSPRLWGRKTVAETKRNRVGCPLRGKPNLGRLEPAGQRSTGPLKVKLGGLARIHKSRERDQAYLSLIF